MNGSRPVSGRDLSSYLLLIKALGGASELNKYLDRVTPLLFNFMKKIIILMTTLIVSSICIYAQETSKEWRKKFINLSFTNVTLSQDNVQDLKSNYGAAFTLGKTYFLHKPISDMLRFGIDATWFDINYSNYKIEHITYWETDKYQYHQGEISLHVGPSITFEPVKKLAVHAYFQYAPTFAMLYTGESETFYGNYASLWVAGGNVSYKSIGLGIESRFGNINYKPLGSSDSDNIDSSLSGFRAYLTFKF